MRCRVALFLAVGLVLGVAGCKPENPDTVTATAVDQPILNDAGTMIREFYEPPVPPAEDVGVLTENLRQCTFSKEGGDYDPDVSPDGEWLVYASTRSAVRPDIYLQSVHGTVVTRKTTNPYSDIMPKFSPDGRLIAYASDRSGKWDIYVMPANGPGEGTRVTEYVNEHAIHPAWHPSGELIAFSALNPSTRSWRLCVVPAVGGPVTVLADGLYPEWSPDGKRLVCQRARHRGVRWYSVWTLDVRVDEEGRVLSVSRPTEVVGSSEWAAINPGFSPDGKRIVFASVHKSVVARGHDRKLMGDDIWCVRTDGRGLIRLTVNNQPDWSPVWTSEKDKPGVNGPIYFCSLVNGFRNVWSLRPLEVKDLDRIKSEAETASPSARILREHAEREARARGEVGP